VPGLCEIDIAQKASFTEMLGIRGKRRTIVERERGIIHEKVSRSN